MSVPLSVHGSVRTAASGTKRATPRGPNGRTVGASLSCERALHKTTRSLGSSISSGNGSVDSRSAGGGFARPLSRLNKAVQLQPSTLDTEELLERCAVPGFVDEEVDPELKATTSFVAETLLPTRSGKFRVRAYRHKVTRRQHNASV